MFIDNAWKWIVGRKYSADKIPIKGVFEFVLGIFIVTNERQNHSFIPSWSPPIHGIYQSKND